MDNHAFFTRKSVVIIMATICCLLWGSSYPAIKNGYAMFDIMPTDIASKMVFAGYRFLFAGVILQIYALISGRNIFRLSIDDWRSAASLGIMQTSIQYTFFYIGLAYTTGVKGSIINSTQTFFSVLLAHFIYHNDKMSPARIMGCLMGFLGVLAVNFNNNLIDFNFTLLGEGFVVISAILLSLGSIYSKKIAQRMDSVVLTAHQLTIGGFLLIFLGYVSGGQLSAPTAASFSLMMYLISTSAVTFVIWTVLLKYNRVGMVSVFSFLIPVFGSLLSAIFLNEQILELKYALALVLVCSGIFLVNREESIRKTG